MTVFFSFKTRLVALVALSALMFISVQISFADGHIGEHAYSDIINNNGKSIGKATYTQGAEGVLIDIQVANLPAGKHGMHFHTVGTCEDIKGFKKSKGHIMPSNRPHGFLNADGGPHEGNLPNLIVAKDGTVHVELYTEMVSISGANGAPALLDYDGSALIIHANPDDHTTQPIGGSGARIACGVVKNKM